MLKARIILPLACIALGACMPVDRGFGETVRWNNELHRVNPEGVEASAGAPIEGGNARRADTAVGKYEAGTVAAPVPESTQSGGQSK